MAMAYRTDIWSDMRYSLAVRNHQTLRCQFAIRGSSGEVYSKGVG